MVALCGGGIVVQKSNMADSFLLYPSLIHSRGAMICQLQQNYEISMMKNYNFLKFYSYEYWTCIDIVSFPVF